MKYHLYTYTLKHKGSLRSSQNYVLRKQPQTKWQFQILCSKIILNCISTNYSGSPYICVCLLYMTNFNYNNKYRLFVNVFEIYIEHSVEKQEESYRNMVYYQFQRILLFFLVGSCFRLLCWFHILACIASFLNANTGNTQAEDRRWGMCFPCTWFWTLTASSNTPRPSQWSLMHPLRAASFYPGLHFSIFLGVHNVRYFLPYFWILRFHL